MTEPALPAVGEEISVIVSFMEDRNPRVYRAKVTAVSTHHGDRDIGTPIVYYRTEDNQPMGRTGLHGEIDSQLEGSFWCRGWDPANHSVLLAAYWLHPRSWR